MKNKRKEAFKKKNLSAGPIAKNFQTAVVKQKLVKPTVFLVFQHLPIITHETGKHIEKTELES